VLAAELPIQHDQRFHVFREYEAQLPAGTPEALRLPLERSYATGRGTVPPPLAAGVSSILAQTSSRHVADGETWGRLVPLH
jgi:hypothetical protein